MGRARAGATGALPWNGELGGHIAWVPEATGATGAMMKSALDDDGFTSDSSLDVLADGADGLESVVREAAERPPTQRLDWFHISMRLRPIEQMVARVAELVPDQAQRRVLQQDTPRLRWQLWHGRGRDAMQRTQQLSRLIRPPATVSTAFDVTSSVCGVIFATMRISCSTTVGHGARAGGFRPPRPNRG